jgi:2-hydroxychromene-2-carboxylate isomerase
VSDERYDWYFDFISPFAYLQWRRLWRDEPTLAARLQPKPLLLAGLLNHWGQLGPAELPGKRRHTYRHVLWQAREQGIALRFPPAHPFNPLPALRLCLAAPDRVVATDKLFAHIWEHGKAGDDLDALAELAARELQVPDLAKAISAQAVKDQLALNGADAIARQAFGVPTLAVGPEIFWGNDSTSMAIAYLKDRSLFDDVEMRRIDHLPATARRPGAKA